MKIYVALLVYSFLLIVYADVDYRSKRKKILDDELKMSIGGNIILDHNETVVNEVLIEWKKQEVDQEFKDLHYDFSHSYFDYKDLIKTSKIYQFIRAMPKGAVLHIHSTAVLGPDYYLNITYKDNLQVCFGGELKFKFAITTPEDPCETQWRIMSEVRRLSDNVTRFDMELKNNFTMATEDLDVNSLWKRFSKFFRVISNLWTYRPVWEDYFYEVLKEIRSDNVMYVEIRSFLPQLYELDGRHHNELFFTNITNSVVERFVRDYPDFLGAKIICSFSRNSDSKHVEELLSLTGESKRVFPDFIVGFDLVGREDLGAPLIAILPQLEAAKAEIDYFLHAGETNWYGTRTDENLIDAVLLGTKRIGHAYALLKHPLILDEVKKNKIGLEVNLVSNNVLGLVSDMRSHPLAAFISQNLPVVVSSDDPGFWDALPLTTDFYLAFVGVASRSHDLRLLRQFALNSIEYSALKPDKKKAANAMFDAKWKTFINGFVENMARKKGLNSV